MSNRELRVRVFPDLRVTNLVLISGRHITRRLSTGKVDTSRRFSKAKSPPRFDTRGGLVFKGSFSSLRDFASNLFLKLE